MRTQINRSAVFSPLLVVLFLGACGGDDGTALGKRQITIPLSYSDDVGSNHGPKDATGTAIIDTVTGKVTITVSGLPKLDKDRYEGWLAGGGEDPISTAKFNTDDTGVGSSDITLGDISGRTYATVVLTVEPEPDPTPKPDPRHSIGGKIPPPSADGR
jgi:hypothetical protein